MSARETNAVESRYSLLISMCLSFIIVVREQAAMAVAEAATVAEAAEASAGGTSATVAEAAEASADEASTDGAMCY